MKPQVPQGQAPWAEAGRVATLWARPALGQGPLGRAALWGLEGLVQLHRVHGIWRGGYIFQPRPSANSDKRMTWPGRAWVHPARLRVAGLAGLTGLDLEEVPLLFLPHGGANRSTEVAAGPTPGSEEQFLSTRATQATPLPTDTANLMAKTNEGSSSSESMLSGKTEICYFLKDVVKR